MSRRFARRESFAFYEIPGFPFRSPDRQVSQHRHENSQGERGQAQVHVFLSRGFIW